MLGLARLNFRQSAYQGERLKILYTASVTATGGRNGRIESSDGLLTTDLALPPRWVARRSNNPEQMFAGGYAACFLKCHGIYRQATPRIETGGVPGYCKSVSAPTKPEPLVWMWSLT